MPSARPAAASGHIAAAAMRQKPAGGAPAVAAALHLDRRRRPACWPLGRKHRENARGLSPYRRNGSGSVARAHRRWRGLTFHLDALAYVLRELFARGMAASCMAGDISPGITFSSSALEAAVSPAGESNSARFAVKNR